MNYAIDSGKETGKSLLETLLNMAIGNKVESMIELTTSSDLYLDKQIKRYLIQQGPGSFLEMPTGMGWKHLPNGNGSIMKQYWFKGYYGDDYKPIFEIKDIPFDESMFGSFRKLAVH